MPDALTEISRRLSVLSKSKSMRYGLPFLIMVVGGSFALKEFAQLRYTFSKQQKLSRKQLEEMGIELKSEEKVTMEAIYEDLKQMDIDNWHNIRGPRPWEEPSPELQAMREKRGLNV